MRAFRHFWGATDGKVFRHGVPTAKTLRRDLEGCGIAHTSETGAFVDFHALRHTWCTTLQQSGVGPRSAQQLMRHSDASLTEKGYTDVNLLPLFSEVRKVKVPSLGASLNFGKTCLKSSIVVQTLPSSELAEMPVSQREVSFCPPLERRGQRPKLAERVGFEIVSVTYERIRYERRRVQQRAPRGTKLR